MPAPRHSLVGADSAPRRNGRIDEQTVSHRRRVEPNDPQAGTPMLAPGGGGEYGFGPLSADDYADGVLDFSVVPGPQSVVNGSSGSNASRAAWSFQYSIASGLNSTTSSLTSHTYQLLYDVDPGSGTVYRTLTFIPGTGWKDEGTGLVFIGDDGTNGTTVTQNSENYGFGFFQSFLTSAYGPGNAFAGPGTFDIVLQALAGSQIVARNHIVVNVGP